MARYLFEMEIAPQGLAMVVNNPQDRAEVIRTTIERIGGKAGSILPGCLRQQGNLKQGHADNDLSGGGGGDEDGSWDGSAYSIVAALPMGAAGQRP